MKDVLSTNYLQFTEEELFVQNNGSFHLGLANGYAGYAVIFYLLAKHFNKKKFRDKGLTMLEDISENSSNIQSLDYGEGLTGIGWSIEWLVQNDLMDDTNTDVILESIDKALYRYVSFSKTETPSLFYGTCGLLKYFVRRLSSIHADLHRYKLLGHLECVVLLTDDLANMITENEKNVEGKPLIKIVDLASILDTVSGIDVNINRPTLDSIIYDGIRQSDIILSNICIPTKESKSIDSNQLLDCLYLSTCYFVCGLNKKYNIWKFQAMEYIDFLVEKIIDNTSDNKDFLFKKLSIFNLLNYYIPKDNFRNEIENLIAILTKIDLSFALNGGRGHLALSELCLQNPRLVNNFPELFFVK